MGKLDYDYLDEERKKLWQKVNTVETEVHRRIDYINEELNKKASDFTDEAKQASKKASEFRNKSEESKTTIFQYLESANKTLAEISEIYSSVQTLSSNITNYANESSENNTLVKGILDDIQSRKDIIETQITQLENIFEDHDSLVDKVEKIQSTLTESEETAAKIETLHRSLLARKKEIDQIYLNIFGYTERDENTGAETIVDGLKMKLETSYVEISSNLKKVEDGLSNLQNQSFSDFEQFSTKNETELKRNLSEWNSRYSELSIKIQELLPNALTAGLSAAYSQKKDAEILEHSKLNTTFNYSIAGLVFVSLIPFAISLISIYQNKPLEKALLDMPRLVLSILPLYIPVLWVAYSSNRKMNLSKRLSEEYSHKEVLSKTFEGLSTQINNISDEKVSNDLRNKLLYNILEVSSENPGKLISDYNKSDHPLMDALDKSVKLATAYEKLEKIPGFSKLAKVINKKSKTILEDEDEKASRGLDVMEEEKGD